MYNYILFTRFQYFWWCHKDNHQIASTPIFKSVYRDVNRFWSSRRKLKSHPPRRACSVPFMAEGLGPAQGPQKLWDKWCKILHSRPLLALNFIIETSFFCTIFLIFSAIVQDKRPFFTTFDYIVAVIQALQFVDYKDVLRFYFFNAI